jgi:hypothetical protein
MSTIVYHVQLLGNVDNHLGVHKREEWQGGSERRLSVKKKRREKHAGPANKLDVVHLPTVSTL